MSPIYSAGADPGFHLRGQGGASVICLKTHPAIYKYGKSAKLRERRGEGGVRRLNTPLDPLVQCEISWAIENVLLSEII